MVNLFKSGEAQALRVEERLKNHADALIFQSAI
jgi:hypothetical protein